MASMTIAGKTEVVIGEGLPPELLPTREGRARVAILTQPAPTPLALAVSKDLSDEGLICDVIGLPDREEAKTLEVAASVYEALARLGLTRYDTIMGVGGGSVTDLAGYVAGTWLRGVEAVHIPTTLLGAVDASIGGKAGVNVGGKNLVGVFWHPTRVLIDLRQLSTLPTFLIREGMAEAYKAGLIGDARLASILAQSGLGAPLDEVVSRAVGVKARLVDQDIEERGVRAFLNFGHTIGHAIEYASALSHGSSVGLGMIAAAAISEKKLGFDSADRVRSAIEGLGLPIEVTGLDLTRVLDLLHLDKKRDSSGARMVLLSAIEGPVLSHVDQSDIELGLASVGF